MRLSALMPTRRPLRTVAVAQTSSRLTGAFLRARSKKRQVVARPRRALPSLGAARPLRDRHSERSPRFRRRLCATATTMSEHVDRGLARFHNARRAASAQMPTRSMPDRCQELRSDAKPAHQCRRAAPPRLLIQEPGWFDLRAVVEARGFEHAIYCPRSGKSSPDENVARPIEAVIGQQNGASPVRRRPESEAVHEPFKAISREFVRMPPPGVEPGSTA
jgi:hypothetical protein